MTSLISFSAKTNKLTNTLYSHEHWIEHLLDYTNAGQRLGANDALFQQTLDRLFALVLHYRTNGRISECIEESSSYLRDRNAQDELDSRLAFFEQNLRLHKFLSTFIKYRDLERLRFGDIESGIKSFQPKFTHH